MQTEPQLTVWFLFVNFSVVFIVTYLMSPSLCVPCSYMSPVPIPVPICPRPCMSPVYVCPHPYVPVPMCPRPYMSPPVLICPRSYMSPVPVPCPYVSPSLYVPTTYLPLRVLGRFSVYPRQTDPNHTFLTLTYP